MNTFGTIFRITTAGESHGSAIVVIIDGCPPNLELNELDIQRELDRRAPGQSSITTPRKESDKCEILSGVFEGKTTGTPITVLVRNENQKSSDYEAIKDIFRPSHADFGYFSKYGIRDYRGGGRASARETIARVIGGAVAKKVLRQNFGVEIYGFSQKIGKAVFTDFDRDFIEKNPLRMAAKKDFDRIMKSVEEIKNAGDSIGGVVEIRVENPQKGWGDPVFGKLEAELGRAILSVPAVKGIEFGEGFGLCEKLGSEANDPFVLNGKEIHTEKNANGGILGGISTGDTIWFRAAIKPTSSISLPQKSVDISGKTVDLAVRGRHDPILLPRAVPVLEAMTALVILDRAMMHAAQNNFLK